VPTGTGDKRGLTYDSLTGAAAPPTLQSWPAVFSTT
jgi:hypothetical protein